MIKRLALTLFVVSAAVLAAEHIFHYGDISRDVAEWMDDHGLPVPEADSFLYWIVMPVLGALALFGLLQSILKVAWVTGVSLLVSFAVHADPDTFADLTEPVMEHLAQACDDLYDEVTSVL